jgi:hypothetical protein
MERATKLIVVGAACAFVALKVTLMSPAWARLLPMSAAFFVAGAVLALFDRRIVRVVLVFLYLFPALISLLHGPYHLDYDVLWLSALVGVIAPDAFRTPWHIPSRWRAPLMLWALVSVASTAIVLAREIDFYPGILGERGVINSVTGGGGPGFVIFWTLHVGLIPIVGILWFDWLFGARIDVGRDVAAPLVASCLVLGGVSLYQALVDFSFLNVNVFGGMGRASGTMADANVSGAIAAFWTGGAVMWAAGLRRWGAPLGAMAFAAAWGAVWTSGSRNAFLLAAFATLSVVVAYRAAIVRAGRGLRPVHAVLAAVVVAAFAWFLSNANPALVGPIARVRDTLPGASVSSVRTFAWRMWDRDRYGSVAVEMIREFPAFGVGVGGYHLMLNDFIREGDLLIPDNAQNWYRHQLVELGIVGSLGWIAWVVAFGWFVLRPPAGAPGIAAVARGMLIAFAIVSLVGMPAQALAVSITFWTMAFWYVALVGPPPAAPLPVRARSAVAIVATLFALGTAYLAATSLRIPARSQRAGFPFSYGFYYPEPDDGDGEYRWARRRASAVVNATGPVMALSVWVNHRDVAEKPVDVRAWVDGRRVLSTTLRSLERVTAYVALPSGERRSIIDTRVNRAVTPAAFGVSDPRELGLMVKWTFLDRAPEGARVETIR